MAVNESICSTFEVQYGKWTSARTTAIRHLRHLKQITCHRSCVVNRQIGVGDSKNVIVFHPLPTGHVIRRMRSGRVPVFNGNQWEAL